jgi:2,4-dienoyl-CoA reductase-like NADH-dependent reductase (Old Yellow Enzyme family)
MTQSSVMDKSKQRTMSGDPLLQPIRIKGLTIKNRILSTSHAISYAQDGKPKQRYQLYQEEKAKGGIGLTMIGGASNVAPDSPSVFGQLYVGDDDVIPYFEELSERIHRYGAALMCQLTHMGRRTSNLGANWLPTIAPSYIREDMHRSFAREMDRHDIDRVVKAFGDAAWRCQEGGLDGCEVIATSHLIDQFWSLRTNHRTDEFGGSLPNRMRFSRMVLDEIRQRTGDDFIISLRMTMEEDSAPGLTREDCLRIAQSHRDDGTIDVLNLVHGHLDTFQGLANYMPGMAAPSAPYLAMAGEFRAEIGLPVFHATRITDVATARHAIREGLVDMVGMTRAHIADPHIVNKINAGEEDRIRPCVGATYCSTYRQCIHNAATGREATLSHLIEPADTPAKKVVVVGGGPGGMEAARVCAERGHKVVLFEAATQLGGQVILAAKAVRRGDMIGISDWLSTELGHLAVDIRFNILAEAEDILPEEPDIVIVAAGGVPDNAEFQGAELCLNVWDVLSGHASPSGKVMVYDVTGKNQAASCVDHLASAGAELEVVSPDSMIAAEVSKIERPFYLQRFYESGVILRPDHIVVRAQKHNNQILVTTRNRLTKIEGTQVVDHLVVENGTFPNDEVYRDLKERSVNGGVIDLDALLAGHSQPLMGGGPGEFQLFAVGDAVSSRDIHAAILDASRLCRTF